LRVIQPTLCREIVRLKVEQNDSPGGENVLAIFLNDTREKSALVGKFVVS
jgi:hypothetical protein